MNLDNLNRDTLTRYIPNVLCEVEGETALYDRLLPFIDFAKLRLEQEYLGPDDFLDDSHNELAMKIVVATALADAVPSLDLVITPTGFGVVSSESIAPASKERVERLITTLRDYAKTQLAVLVRICKKYEAWRNSCPGRGFCDTFLAGLDGVPDVPGRSYTYEGARTAFTVIEAKMAELCLGHTLMAELREAFHAGTIAPTHPLVAMIQQAEAALLPLPRYTDEAVWRITNPIVNELRYYPEYRAMWKAEMADKFEVPEFNNNVQGGYFF